MEQFRSLPKVDKLSQTSELEQFPERVRVEAARQAVELMRGRIERGEGLDGLTAADLAVERAFGLTRSTLKTCVNLSGVVLHTGLGRARLAKSAVAHIAEVAAVHAMLEFDADSGKRGDRQDHVRDLLCQLTGAEDALVVNNAAAGVTLALRGLAGSLEVILSRGQMVEIGGSFRMPEIVLESGCELVEIGCTNKTRLDDYRMALSEDTGAILRCHTSNFKVIGFTEQPELSEIVKLAEPHGVPVIDDMGTGCIVDTTRFGMVKVPTIQDSLRAGADVVIASGDKLLGGPQAGLVLGKADVIASLKNEPLARAMRVDKLTIAALEATLRLYIEGRENEIPTLRYLGRPEADVRQMADALSASAKNSRVERGTTEVGGGSAPGTGVTTWRVGLNSNSADALARRLRLSDPAIIARIEDGSVWLDPRTLEEDELEAVCEVLKSL